MNTYPSPRTAVILSLLLFGCGLAPILAGLEVIPLRLTDGTPAWVGIAAGMVFVLAGMAMVNLYVFGGKDFDTAASPLAYTTQQLLGFSICALFAAIGGWIAFGSGERNFSTSIDLPFWQSGGPGDQTFGRAFFGFGALTSGAVALYALFCAVRRRR